MSLTEVVASLLGEPFFIPLDQIRRLSRRQIQQLYFHPRDEKTGLVQVASRSRKKKRQDHHEQLRKWMWLNNLPQHVIEARIRVMVEEEKAKKAAEKTSKAEKKRQAEQRRQEVQRQRQQRQQRPGRNGRG